MRRDDPTRSILLIVLAMFSASCSDVIAKLLGASLPPVEIAWMRWVGFLAIIAPLILARRRTVFRTGALKAQVLRAAVMVVSSITFIAALTRLPIAEASAIAFVAPLMVTALSIPMLGERVGPRRWAAVAVGLVGVLVVMRPGGGVFDADAALPLASALGWALSIIYTRVTGRTDGALTTMAYGATLGVAALSLMVPFVWTTPSAAHVGWAVLMASTSTIGQFLTILAYRGAPASLLVPFSYSQIVWSGLAGIFVFGHVPDAATWIGTAIIIASGVYTAHRERVQARQATGEAGAGRP